MVKKDLANIWIFTFITRNSTVLQKRKLIIQIICINFSNLLTIWRKKNKDYQDYINDLLEYLLDFLDRSNPLYDVKRKSALIVEEFNLILQKDGEFSWKKFNEMTTDLIKMKRQLEGNDLDAHDLVEEVKANEKETNPLFCEACCKLFAKETVFKGHLTGKNHKKALAKLQNKTAFNDLYKKEFLIYNLTTDLLFEVIENTKINIEKNNRKPQLKDKKS